MSMFTKRRKISRQEKVEKQHRWDENVKKQNKSIENMIKTAEIIEKEYPEFKSLDGDERIKFFSKIFKKLQNDTKY